MRSVFKMRSTTFALAAIAGLAAASPMPQDLDLALLDAAPEVATGPTDIAVVDEASIISTVVASTVATPSSTATSAAGKRDLEKRTFGLFSPFFFYKGLECEIFHNCGSKGSSQGGWGCGKPTETKATWSLITTSAPPTSIPAYSYTTDSAAVTTSAAVSTSSSVPTTTQAPSTTADANAPCPTTPEDGTYCGFINPEDACAPQPGGYGPQVQPDTVDAFYSYAPFHAMASAAPTVVPSSDKTQYTQVFKDLDAAVSANSYIGLYTLTSYSAQECAAKCDDTDLCTSFNLYIERDPSLAPANNDNTTYTPWETYCPNPSSITNYKCTLWGSSLSVDVATNKGDYREEFQTVITGSNAYDKTNVTTPTCEVPTAPATTSIVAPTKSAVAPPPCKQPTLKPAKNCGPKAISAPKHHMGSTFIPGPYNANHCSSYAASQNVINKNAAIKAGQRSFTPCKMFNAYFLHKDNKPYGTYCSLYGAALDSSWATFGGSGHYQTHQSWTWEFDFETKYYSW
ncbi:hypothetical protein D6D01_10277 [Aureobasidium pullulans]|uniref:Apple domain-containing protein n=1 Tax=Aureobasidium pullulans TaxID=5580 RepID=A0A4S9JLH2_AURPU|nr:hypothetical protein D6D01_10277 [Aureobasidium pullulans]